MMKPRMAVTRAKPALEVARRIAVWSAAALAIVLGVYAAVRVEGGYWILLAWGGYAIVGALILNARRGNAIGRILLFIGCYWPLYYGFLDFPEVSAAVPTWVEPLAYWAGDLVWLAVPLVLLLFPSGRFQSRLGRALGWVLAGIVLVLLVACVLNPAPLPLTGRANPTGIPALAAPLDLLLGDATFLLVPIAVAAAVVELAIRWRRSRGPERLQFRWLAFGGSVLVAMIAVIAASPVMPFWVAIPVQVGLNALPVSLYIAISRHGLWEIGRVLSRTVAYAVVAIVVGGVYAGVVVGIGALVPGGSPIVVALATLAAAAVFLPLLRGVQHRLDRAFDRERYDAEKVVDAFGQRLRTGADPASTVPELVRAVERTLQPAAVGVWTASSREGATPPFRPASEESR